MTTDYIKVKTHVNEQFRFSFTDSFDSHAHKLTKLFIKISFSNFDFLSVCYLRFSKWLKSEVDFVSFESFSENMLGGAGGFKFE